MKMTIFIYRNNEQVNKIETSDAAKIYFKIAEILKNKLYKNATKTTIKWASRAILEATEIFDQDKTQILNTKYKYNYIFNNVEL